LFIYFISVLAFVQGWDILTLDIYLTTKTKQQVKNTLYLVGTTIRPNLSYLLTVRLAASTAIPFNKHKLKKKKHCKLSQSLCCI